MKTVYGKTSNGKFSINILGQLFNWIYTYMLYGRTFIRITGTLSRDIQSYIYNIFSGVVQNIYMKYPTWKSYTFLPLYNIIYHHYIPINSFSFATLINTIFSSFASRISPILRASMCVHYVCKFSFLYANCNFRNLP